jgi:hypothetical protein
MRIYEDLIASAARQRPPIPGRRASGPASRGGANQPPTADGLDASSILGLQRLAGNAAVSGLLTGSSRKDDEVGAPQPHFDVGSFSRDNLGRSFGAMPDKSATEVEEERDQAMEVGTFSALPRGLKIIAEASGVYESQEYPDGFKFTQTIETNAPLHGGDSPYVDPHPNDDTKPFYWTDEEQRQFPTTFKDHPSRNPPTGSAATYWQATLALMGVNESSKTMTGFDYITYGFVMDAAGNVKLSFPQSIDGENHRQTLKNEWSSWKIT